eukprot:641636-Pelagomonas_calceolata.AAC.6
MAQGDGAHYGQHASDYLADMQVEGWAEQAAQAHSVTRPCIIRSTPCMHACPKCNANTLYTCIALQCIIHTPCVHALSTMPTPCTHARPCSVSSTLSMHARPECIANTLHTCTALQRIVHTLHACMP